ncbi:Peptidase S8 [Flavobacterium sp. 9AF]|uniref:S8 family peptidase n=1 Tax=Flavobacterium sp. 9AF TaxID=2653142 RepID=UPI0012F11B7E|nr:S8 family peptidase [Flavobacterium sp. 9AF]VXB14526.1 Peptidase S8 [Flavobacterium sp. 9AF]
MKIHLLSLLFVVNCFSQSNIVNTNEWHFNSNSNGVSLEKWYSENSKETSNTIIVATLDTQIDLDHEDLKNQIWINEKEIPNNGIDDDKNGYIDDRNGWNFIGVGNNNIQAFSNFEFVRFIKKNKDLFQGRDSLKYINTPLYREYKRALKKYESEYNYYTEYLKAEGILISAYYPAKDTLKYYFPKEDYTTRQLDSLYQIHKTNNKTFVERVNNNDPSREFPDLIFYMKMIKKLNFTIEQMENSSKHKDSIVKKLLNFDYDDRIRIKNHHLEKGYGNNSLDSHERLKKHNTEVSSIIIANRNNNKGVKGFHNNIQVMPLIISPFGDEHDEDIANAIYYAVDNGARVINMSFSKEFSLNQKIVTTALQYAEDKNVLVVHTSGNASSNIDLTTFYPTDFNYTNSTEIVNNLITVGSISKRTDSTMVSPFSNYGKNNVDLFAPGEDIYVAIPDNQYTYDSGTSLAAPMVSGTAALIWLYYPNLTVQEVKKIILESGVTIDKMVVKPGTENELVHFSELCKSGKILNTYNAMKMAEEMSKKKKNKNID